MKVNISDNEKKLVVESIQNALAEAHRNNLRDGIAYSNGAPLYTLNFIFKHIDDLKVPNWEYHRFKRGPYEQTLIYDKRNKMLISLTSESNLKRLKSRKSIDRIHYIDSLVLYNKDIASVQPISMFSDMPEWLDDREKIQRDIEQLINEKDIKCYMVLEYRIHYKAYTLYGLKSVLLSPIYAVIESQDWGKFISPDYNDVLLGEEFTYNAPIEQTDSPYVKQKGLAINIKKSS